MSTLEVVLSAALLFLVGVLVWVALRPLHRARLCRGDRPLPRPILLHDDRPVHEVRPVQLDAARERPVQLDVADVDLFEERHPRRGWRGMRGQSVRRREGGARHGYVYPWGGAGDLDGDTDEELGQGGDDFVPGGLPGSPGQLPGQRDVRPRRGVRLVQQPRLRYIRGGAGRRDWSNSRRILRLPKNGGRVRK